MTFTHAWRPVEHNEFDTDYILHEIKTSTRIFTTCGAANDDKVAAWQLSIFNGVANSDTACWCFYLHNYNMKNKDQAEMAIIVI